MNPKAWVEAVFELIWRIGVRLALWVGGVYIAYRVRSIIVTVVLAAVVTYAIVPLVDFLCAHPLARVSRRMQRLMATLLVFILLGASLVLLTCEFFRPFQDQFDSFWNSKSYVATIKGFAANARVWYDALPPDAQKFLERQNFNALIDKGTKWAIDESTQMGSSVLSSTARFFSHLLEVLLIPVLAFYFLLDSRSLKREFVALVPRRRARETLALLHELNGIMRSYIVGQIILCMIAGIVVGLLLWAFNMPYQLILGVFAGITRAVPVIGPIISGIIIVALGLTHSTMLGVKLLVMFVILHFAESKFIMPKLIGHRMQLHPALIILVLLVGAEFFGVFGMFMAAPVAAIIRVLIRYYVIKPKKLHVWGMPNGSGLSGKKRLPDHEPLVSTTQD